MQQSDAYKTYLKSTVIGFDEWHDGTGYDLTAFATMTAAEREEVVKGLLAKGNLDWREIEVLAAHGGVAHGGAGHGGASASASVERLRDMLTDPSVDTRAHALRELINAGKTPGAVADVQLSHVLDAVTGDDGLTPALLLATAHAGPWSKLALLRGARDRPDVAIHFASTLMDLHGLSDDMAAFDPKFRPMLLRLLPDNALADRVAAFGGVCQLLDIDPATIPTPDDGQSIAWAERRWPRDGHGGSTAKARGREKDGEEDDL